jgi:hypothetical protein
MANSVLLNILIALYNSSYDSISDNAVDEYMALFAQKTLQFVRAPDEYVYIPREFDQTYLCAQLQADSALLSCHGHWTSSNRVIQPST